MKIDEELLDIESIKKSNKPLLELFIRRTAVLTLTKESLVEKIVKDQWAKANKITQPGNPISEMDFCNLGTFYMSKPKSKKRIARINKMSDVLRQKDPELGDRTKERIEKNEQIIKSIKIKTKTNED